MFSYWFSHLSSFLSYLWEAVSELVSSQLFLLLPFSIFPSKYIIIWNTGILFFGLVPFFFSLSLLCHPLRNCACTTHFILTLILFRTAFTLSVCFLLFSFFFYLLLFWIFLQSSSNHPPSWYYVSLVFEFRRWWCFCIPCRYAICYSPYTPYTLYTCTKCNQYTKLNHESV